MPARYEIQISKHLPSPSPVTLDKKTSRRLSEVQKADSTTVHYKLTSMQLQRTVHWSTHEYVQLSADGTTSPGRQEEGSLATQEYATKT